MSNVTIASPVEGSNYLVDIAARILIEHNAAATALEHCLTHAIAAGDLLIQAKDQVPHGSWLPWLHDNCEMSVRGAQAYMKLARGKEQIEQIRRQSEHLTLKQGLAVLSKPPLPAPVIPEKYAELCREVMGSIGDKHVLIPIVSGTKAERLDLIAKLLADYESGTIAEAIVLTHNSTDTDWATILAYKHSAICFTLGRIKLTGPNPVNGQIFWYFGKNPDRFRGVFDPAVGSVLGPAIYAPPDHVLSWYESHGISLLPPPGAKTLQDVVAILDKPKPQPNDRAVKETNKFHREIGDFIIDLEPRFRSWFHSTRL
jgi:DUF3102 family protein